MATARGRAFEDLPHNITIIRDTGVTPAQQPVPSDSAGKPTPRSLLERVALIEHYLHALDPAGFPPTS